MVNPELGELSGVAAATRQADVVYAHNDSSDSARLFAVSASGDDLGVIEVDDADNDDWEDIAQGPCASGSCLFIGDIGDNNLQRAVYAIYVVDEPASVDVGRVDAQRIDFTYEDGPHNAETLLVHPSTGVVTIVDKAESGPAKVYELPALVPGETLVAQQVATLEPPEGSAKFTGGAIHPDGSGILLRTKSRLFHFPVEAGESAGAALGREPCRLPLADEAQGEAVTWLGRGDEFMTVGEGAGAPVSVSSCAR